MKSSQFLSEPAATAPLSISVPLKGEEEEDEDTCIICLDNVANVKLRPCGHSATCKGCTEELMNLKEPCRKEVFDVLEIGNARDVGLDLPLERQVLTITRLEDLVKLRALAKLCSVEFFDDMSLLVVAWRRILEVLVLAMPPVVEKKARRRKKQKKKKNDPWKLEILDACAALRRAYNWVEDCDDARRYYKRAKEGYEEQLGRDSENALDVTRSLIGSDGESRGEQIEKLRELLKRMERVLGEEHVLTLETLNKLGCELKDNGEYEEAREVYERCLAGQLKVLGEEHKDTLCTLNNLGIVYQRMKDYEKAFEYYERALKGHERLLGKNHPSTLIIVMDIAIVYDFLKDYGKVEELYERVLEGYEVQLGKDNGKTKKFARNFKQCLDEGGNNSERLAALMSSYPGLAVKK